MVSSRLTRKNFLLIQKLIFKSTMQKYGNSSKYTSKTQILY